MQGVDLVFLNKSSKSFAGASSSFFFCFRATEDKKIILNSYQYQITTVIYGIHQIMCDTKTMQPIYINTEA